MFEFRIKSRLRFSVNRFGITPYNGVTRQHTGATESVFKGNIDLKNRNPEFFKR